MTALTYGPLRISHCQVLLLICTVHKPEARVYIVAQKLDRSHLCNCVVPSKQNVKLTTEYVPPLLPLHIVFFLSSKWNKTQVFFDCMGKKSQTDYSLLFPTMERASLKMSAWKATGTDMVNNGWYWFSSPVLFFAYNSVWWLSFTYLEWICERFRLSACYLLLCSQLMSDPFW